MSPAPLRTRPTDSRSKFPGSWGYGLGTVLMIAGVAVALVLIIGGLSGFADDVRDLRRAVNPDSLELSLEEGEYLVFDEDGLDLGPFNAKVTRTSDGRDIPTAAVNDGTSYDVDGLSGKAKVGFSVPTSDIYRVELDTSVGDVLGFAVGSDVGNNRANAVTRGVLFGTILFGLGVVAVVVTLFQHARWRLRTQLAEGATKARQAVAQVAELADPGDVGGSTRRAAAFGRDRLGKAREVVAQVDGASPIEEALEAQANAVLDGLEQQLGAMEPAVEAVAEAAPAPAELAGRIDEAIGRVQDRLASGDRLRDIARDETTLAKESAAQLGAEVQATKQAAIEQAESVAATVRPSLPPPLRPERPEVPPAIATEPDPPPRPTPPPPLEPQRAEAASPVIAAPNPAPPAKAAKALPSFTALAPPPAQPKRLARAGLPDKRSEEPEAPDDNDGPSKSEPPKAEPALSTALQLAPPPDYSSNRLKRP